MVEFLIFISLSLSSLSFSFLSLSLESESLEDEKLAGRLPETEQPEDNSEPPSNGTDNGLPKAPPNQPFLSAYTMSRHCYCSYPLQAIVVKSLLKSQLLAVPPSLPLMRV